MGAAPVRLFRRVTPHVALSEFAERALTEQDVAALEAAAAGKATVVGISKRTRDGLWLGRAGGEQAVGRTAFDAGRLVLGLDCE